MAAGEAFYSMRNAPQIIRLARKESNNPLTPTGSYCCTIPTTRGEITLCAKLGKYVNHKTCNTLSAVHAVTCLSGASTRTCQWNYENYGAWS